MANPTDSNWSLAHNVPDSATKKSVLAAASRELVHLVGFVHGDLRAANTLYGDQGQNVRVRLFDYV
jgi:aminoglycoside phosphotransferase (APT) family kinase protein